MGIKKLRKTVVILIALFASFCIYVVLIPNLYLLYKESFDEIKKLEKKKVLLEKTVSSLKSYKKRLTDIENDPLCNIFNRMTINHGINTDLEKYLHRQRQNDEYRKTLQRLVADFPELTDKVDFLNGRFRDNGQALDDLIANKHKEFMKVLISLVAEYDKNTDR